METTSSFKSEINKLGIVIGWIAIVILTPFAFGFLTGATTDYFPENGSLYAEYLYFMGSHPFVLITLCLGIAWMIYAYFHKVK